MLPITTALSHAYHLCDLLTSALLEKVYANFSEKNMLPDERKGCRKDLRGRKEQLFISNVKHCQKHQHNLAMR